MNDPRGAVGLAGERFAAWWLNIQGLRVTKANLEVGDGEIDLLARDGEVRVAVEVRAITGPGDPLDAISPAKRRRVSSLARRVGATRVDFLGVAFRADSVEIHWLPG